MKKSLYIILALFSLSVSACVTSSDLRTVRSELNQQMEEKIATLDGQIGEVKKEQEKNTQALSSMRKGQANTTADFSELRDQIQQLRGQIETLQKSVVRDTRKEDDYNEQLDNLLLKINFIENFLEIGKKHSLSDGYDITVSTGDVPAKPDKAAMYSSAYQLFKDGQYTKARTAFQNFLSAHPKSEYSDNAQFWIGECFFFEKNYEKAILEYEKVTKNYPDGNRVPYALLKQGLSFLNLGDKTSARLLLQQVIRDFPNTNQARIARAKLQEIK
ncbi:MAG: tol-pal system protein YbgF [Smithellaceae bacterium]